MCVLPIPSAGPFLWNRSSWWNGLCAGLVDVWGWLLQSGRRTTSKRKYELGWPFHAEFGMGNPLPFYQPPCPLLRTEKETFILWAAHPYTHLNAQLLSTANQTSNLSSPAQESQQEAILEDVIVKTQSSSAWDVQGRLGKKEAPIILPGGTESPENDKIRGCHFILEIGFWLLRSLDFAQAWGSFLDLYQLSSRSWAQIWSSPVCPYSFLRQPHIYGELTVCQGLW